MKKCYQPMRPVVFFALVLYYLQIMNFSLQKYEVFINKFLFDLSGRLPAAGYKNKKGGVPP